MIGFFSGCFPLQNVSLSKKPKKVDARLSADHGIIRNCIESYLLGSLRQVSSFVLVTLKKKTHTHFQ